MRGVALWILGLVISCAPDYAHTAFRCVPDSTGSTGSADGTDAQCPGDQQCILGRCRRPLPGHTSDGIACTTQGFHQCTLGDQCCWVEGVPQNTGCVVANQTCKGISALCDTKSDCPLIGPGDSTEHEFCCAEHDTLFCDKQCNNYACQADVDCPPTAPHCCTPDRAVPWGTCSDDSCLLMSR